MKGKLVRYQKACALHFITFRTFPRIFASDLLNHIKKSTYKIPQVGSHRALKTAEMCCKRGLFPQLEIGKLFVNSRFSGLFPSDHLRFIECGTRIRPQINGGMPNLWKKWGKS